MTLDSSAVNSHLWLRFQCGASPGEDMNLGFTPSTAQAEFLLIFLTISQLVKGSFLPGYDVGPEHRVFSALCSCVEFSALCSCAEKNFLISRLIGSDKKNSSRFSLLRITCGLCCCKNASPHPLRSTRPKLLLLAEIFLLPSGNWRFCRSCFYLGSVF